LAALCLVHGLWFIGYAAAGGQFISIASKSETSNHNLFLLPSLLLDAG
jgi:hypothetical protein